MKTIVRTDETRYHLIADSNRALRLTYCGEIIDVSTEKVSQRDNDTFIRKSSACKPCYEGISSMKHRMDDRDGSGLCGECGAEYGWPQHHDLKIDSDNAMWCELENRMHTWSTAQLWATAFGTSWQR